MSWSEADGGHDGVPVVEDDTDQPLSERIAAIKAAMYKAAEDLDFEKAAELRDEMKRLEGGEDRDGKIRKKKGKARRGQRPRR